MGYFGPPLLTYSIAPALYPLLGVLAGYVLVMRTNPVRIALRDGFRCTSRFKRLWLIFALLALAYSAFQFTILTPLQPTADLRLEQFAFWEFLALAAFFPGLAREFASHRRIGGRNLRCHRHHLSAFGSRGHAPDP